MKIAAITDDGHAISQHFGRAPYYLVLTIEDGRIVERVLRDKLGHANFADQPHESELPGQPHGYGPIAQNRHTLMASAIADCQVLLCGGMGAGAYESMRARGIKPVVTDLVSIDEAVRAFIEGRLIDQTERLH
jgi:predicted Fe-Mo cluster-binding NifX family protein